MVTIFPVCEKCAFPCYPVSEAIGGRNEEWQVCGMEMRCSVSFVQSASFHPSPQHKSCWLPGPLGRDLPCSSSTADGHLSSVLLSVLPARLLCCDLSTLGS